MSKSEKLREQILSLVKEYYDETFKGSDKLTEDSRISYAGRVFYEANLNALRNAA